MMDENIEELLAGYVSNSQTESEKQALQNALQAGEIKETEVNELKSFYAKLEALPVPEPGPAVRSNFYQMLAEEKRKEQARRKWWFSLNSFLQSLLVQVPLGKLAYGLVLLAAGVFLGTWFNKNQNTEAEKLAALTSEMQQMKQMMMLTLLEQPSATDRLKAVSLTTDMETADDKVIKALLQTLNHDPNVNVRLSAIEALYQHADNPLARQGLVQAIGKQESPLVQLALADVVVAMQEKNAVTQLQKLLHKDDLNEAVKAKVKESIQVLI